MYGEHKDLIALTVQDLHIMYLKIKQVLLYLEIQLFKVNTEHM